MKFPFLQRKEVGSISANSVWIPFHPDLNCGGVVKTFQRGESQVWISALLIWVGLSRFLPCVSAGSYSRGEMELIKKKLIKIYAEKIPRIHAFSPPELKRLFVIDKKKGGGVTVTLRSHPSAPRPRSIPWPLRIKRLIILNTRVGIVIYKLASFRDFFFLEATGPYDPLRKTSF